jgi:deoxyhypusine synthase
MSPYELLDLALSLSNRIDNHWTLFITVHLALIGGLIYVDRPLLKNEKLAAVIIYTGFAVINFLMMLHQEQFLGSVYLQLFEIREQACCVNNRVIDFVVNLNEYNSTEKAIYSIAIVHIVMYVVLTVSIFFDTSLSNKVLVDKETDAD